MVLYLVQRSKIFVSVATLYFPHLSALLEDLLGLNPEDGVQGVGVHVPRGERVLEEGVGLAPLLARHSLWKCMKIRRSFLNVVLH